MYLSGYENMKCPFLRVIQGGGVSTMVHEQKKWRITDHGYNNFVFPNHENKQVRYFFSMICSYIRNSIWRKQNPKWPSQGSILQIKSHIGVSIKFEVGSLLEKNNWLWTRDLTARYPRGVWGHAPPENFDIWKLWNAICSILAPNWVQNIKENFLSTATFFFQ